jgi:hypothetical protein
MSKPPSPAAPRDEKLAEAGHRCDVELAGEMGVSPVVPVLADGVLEESR